RQQTEHTTPPGLYSHCSDDDDGPSEVALGAFNLDAESPVLYSGPPGSYFGYSVDFYRTNPVSILIGAPKANTTQPNITEGGSVYYCPWSLNQPYCSAIIFDLEGDRTAEINDTAFQMDFKSRQWFGATVRAHGNTILACAPLYYWRTFNDAPHSDATGTCYLSTNNFSRIVEYAPCRSERGDREGQGYCQGGFSADFTKSGKVVLGGPGSFYWQGQVISATTEEIVNAYYPGYFRSSVMGQIQTKQAQSGYDDSYLGMAASCGFIFPKHHVLSDIFQMGSYFGYTVAVTDINHDGQDDLLVGAPMFMVRGSGGRLEEMGRVYIYLQWKPLELERNTSHLTGTQVFGRFGSSIAPLGDLNQDGFNDVAVSSPFGGEDEQGLVFIYNGHADGLRDMPSQVLVGQWASSTMPASFGSAIRGNADLDMNGYPDLMIQPKHSHRPVSGLPFGRARPIVHARATLTVYPSMINPEEKNCLLTNGNESTFVSCVNLSYCLAASGKHVPEKLVFLVEVQLDRLKQKGAVRRALFIDTRQPVMQMNMTLSKEHPQCYKTQIYLRDEKEFRDKLSSIYVGLNFSLDPHAAADAHGLRPILNYQTADLIEQKAQILLDCGEDNICVPDLKLAVHGDKKEIFLGDENSVMLMFNARNEGEGGAYEAELYVVLPPEADYSGIARNNESFTQLTCSYETENQTRYLSCDLGNPMKSGTSLWAGLRFTVPRLKDTRKMVQFDLQIRSKNENNSQSEVVPYKLDVVVQADVILQGVSRPDKVFFPPSNWKVTKKLQVEEDIGPSVQHVYELVNNGPSRISQTLLEVHCPMKVQGHRLVYPLEVTTQGPVNCTTNGIINPLELKVRTSCTSQGPGHHVERRETHRDLLSELSNVSCSNVECWKLSCNVGLLERGTSAILKVRSRIWAETFIKRTYKHYVLECSAKYTVQKMPYIILPREVLSGAKKMVTPVVWSKPDSQYAVPLWIIILAVLVGLLLLALLIYVLYKLGFFKRSLPYGTAMEKAQLKPQATSEA
uniref:Integrin, alpha 5 (fibronectin receptor, alpha polypeptide) n=1 Tax=Scleropages formosus TaxID=113540 RepID=A0A8C9ST53_SCLFO